MRSPPCFPPERLHRRKLQPMLIQLGCPHLRHSGSCAITYSCPPLPSRRVAASQAVGAASRSSGSSLAPAAAACHRRCRWRCGEGTPWLSSGPEGVKERRRGGGEVGCAMDKKEERDREKEGGARGGEPEKRVAGTFERPEPKTDENAVRGLEWRRTPAHHKP